MSVSCSKTQFLVIGVTCSVVVIVLGVLPAGRRKRRNTLEHGNRVDIGRPPVAAPTDYQVAAISAAQFQQIRKMVYAIRPSGRERIGCAVISPELFAVIKPDEVWIVPVKLFINSQIKIRKVADPPLDGWIIAHTWFSAQVLSHDLAVS